MGDVISEDIFSYVDEEVLETKPTQENVSESQKINSAPENSHSNDNLNP